MSMLALIADIHGNYHALQAVLAEVGKLGCRKIVSMGDIAGYYPMINECIELCRDADVVNILGNHDDYLLSGRGCPRSTSANMCIEYQRKVITPANLDWLGASLTEYRAGRMFLVHGGWCDRLDEYIGEFDFSICSDEFDLYGSAHTHIQKLAGNGRYCYVNPGSVGQPRDGVPEAAFATVDPQNGVRLHRIPYDIDAIARATEAAGFARRFYEGLYTGSKIKTYQAEK